MAWWRADRKRWAIRIEQDGGSRIRLVKASSAEHAERLRAAIQARLDAHATRVALPAEGTATLASLVEPWARKRAKEGVRTADTERGHLVNHVVPMLGDRSVASIRVADALDVVHALRAKGCAPRTVRNVCSSARSLWSELVIREVVPSNPWAALRGRLPKIKDRDQGWREEAWFSREEVELLISSEQIPVDRRMMNGILFLAGLRISEAAGLKWKHYDPADQPLGRITIAHSYEGPTKTDRTRHAPAHPTLAAMLAEWRLTWWPALFGRKPDPEDFIVPGPPGPMWNDRTYRSRFQADLARLGLRVKAGGENRMRSPHNARATFLTLGVDDGARLEVLERATHTAQKGSAAQRHYLRASWPALCGEVSKLNIRRPGGRERTAAAANGSCSQDCSQPPAPPTIEQDREGGRPEMTANSARHSSISLSRAVSSPSPATRSERGKLSGSANVPRLRPVGGSSSGAAAGDRKAARLSLWDQLEAALGAGDLKRAVYISRRLRRGETGAP